MYEIVKIMAIEIDPKRNKIRYIVSLDMGKELAEEVGKLCKANKLTQGAVIRLLCRKALSDGGNLSLSS